MANKGGINWRWLLAIPVLMFGFGFALVPLYDVFCRVTGLNGKVNATPFVAAEVAPSVEAQKERSVIVQFVTQNNANMAWRFEALDGKEVSVLTGANHKAIFRVTNPTNMAMDAQAVPSISPSEAAKYFHKVQCFCFNQQHLAAGEHLDMPVVFTVDKALPEYIKTITLAYTLFDTTKMAER